MSVVSSNMIKQVKDKKVNTAIKFYCLPYSKLLMSQEYAQIEWNKSVKALRKNRFGPSADNFTE